jgi:hypothetical protein
MSDHRDEALEEFRWQTEDLPSQTVRREIRAGVTLAGRFEIGRRLGAGGMGQVFAAFDRTRQTRVAVKILGRLTPRSIRELKREFRAASEIVHPNLVPLHQLFCDDVEWLFSMDLVEGVSLPDLCPGSRPPEDLVRHVFRQLAVALGVLHNAGTLHGDLKPSNFLITPKEHRVVLLDFGLARPIGLVLDGDYGGTPGYMAPEQALGGPLTQAADWYSFGVVLYEALSGVLPFRNPSEQRLADAPADLRELCLQLLRIRPEERPSGEEVLRCLGVAAADVLFSPEAPGSRRGLVNRHAELAALQREFQTVRQGRAAIALLHGPSGIGKTALVEAFVQAACGQGAKVLASRCRERESMGYKAADGLVDDIVRVLTSLGVDEAAEFVPDGIEDLTVLFPALNAVHAIEHAPRRKTETADHAVVRLRAISAFQKMLERFGARAPIILWMDDLQWSDAESALLVGPLLRSSELPILFIGSYRSLPEGRGPMLDALLGDAAPFPAPVEIPLAPLSPEASERLALESLRSREPGAAAIARTIGRDAGGHPLFIAELAHAVGSSEAPDEQRRPSTLVELVRGRVAALPTDAKTLLEFTAVAGVPLSRGVLRRTSGIGSARMEEALDLLRACRLVRSHGPNEDDTIDTHHDRIREIVAAHLDDEGRKGHHRELARVLEEDTRTKPDVLAVHHHGAGDLPRAARHWIVAADMALRALAFEHAADLFEKGLAHAVLDAGERRQLQLRRAEALAYAGRGPAAADVYLEVARTSDQDEALELRRRAAEQLLLSGHLDRGLDLIGGVLRSLGMRETDDRPRDLAAILRARVLVRLRGLHHVARRESELAGVELARLDASWTLSCSLSLVDPVRGAAFQSRHLLMALSAGEPRRLLRALTLELSYAATPGVGSERRTARILAVADELVRGHSDDAALALLSIARGIAAYLQGRVASALTSCEEALALLSERGVGAVWETLSAQRFAIAALFFLGQLHRLVEFVAPALAAAEDTRNLYATMCFRSGYSTVAWLARDRVDEARRQLDRGRDEWKGAGGAPLFLYNLLIGEVFVDLYTGNAESALARLDAQWPKLAQAHLLRIGVLRVQLWHLRAAALCQVANDLRAGSESGRAAELRREARRIAKRLRADRITRAEAFGDLVDAAVDRTEGKLRSAQRRLRRCAATFDKLGMRLFAAASLVRLGDMTHEGDGDALVRAGHATFESEGVVNAARMIDLLAPGFGPSLRAL